MLIDIHTHAGQKSGGERDGLDVEVLDSMAPSGMDVVVAAIVSDAPVIKRNPLTRTIEQFREPSVGECFASTTRGLECYDQCRIIREPGEVQRGNPGIVLAIEGCDFVEGDLRRLDIMEAYGVRSIQLSHYVVNEMGDIQTSQAVHGGLSPIGNLAVHHMNRRGIIVDVAHSSENTVRDIARISRYPFICSHSNLNMADLPGSYSKRFISIEYARMVADSGGVVGAWLASSLADDPLPGLITHLFRLIDTIGVDHVSIGTDMPAGGSAEVMRDFSRHWDLRSALCDRGMHVGEVDKVCGENWLRVFRAARSASSANTGV